MGLSRILISLFLSLVGIAVAGARTPDVERRAFEIELERGHISGILVTRADDSRIVGTMVNEFGVTALSFVYHRSKDKIELMDVLKMLDKWYIKKVLRNDLKYCVRILNGMPVKNNRNYIVESVDGKVSVTNSKRKIRYSFEIIEADTENETTEQSI